MWFISGHAEMWGGGVASDGVSRHIGLRLNGDRKIAIESKFSDAFSDDALSVAAVYPLGEGDYVELVCFHDSTKEFFAVNNRGLSPELRGQFLTEMLPGSTPAWKGLHTWATGDVLTAAHLNDQLRDNAGFLRYRPAAALAHSDSQNITSGAWQTMNLDTLLAQNGTWNGTANVLTVPTGMGGLYLIGAALAIDGTTGGTVKAVSVLHNNTNIVLTRNFGGFGANQSWAELSAVRLFRLAAGDTLRLRGFQDTGGTITAMGEFLPLLSCCWMAP
jgi:hypothetical protein